MKVVKRARHEKPYGFKKKGNEEQSNFNSGVEETLAEAEAELAGVGASLALERAQQSLERGRKLIAERQKLIRIADRSELGWGVVAEYTADELAEDSDDEKAERAAERKAGKRRKKRAEQQTFARRATRVGPPVGTVTAAGPSGNLAAYQVGRRPPTALPQLQPTPRTVGPCFACGEMGHLRYQCPKTAGSGPDGSRKWYPLKCTDIQSGGQCGESSMGSWW